METAENGGGIDEAFHATACPLRSNLHILAENVNCVMINTKAG